MTAEHLFANKALMRKMVRTFETGNLSDVTALIDPEYVDHQGLGGVPLEGIDGFRRVVAAARTAWPGLRIGIDELIAVEDRVIARLHWDGTTVADEQGDRETIEIIRVTNGRAVEHWGWTYVAPPGTQFRHPLQLVDYDPRWPELFGIERQRLQSAIGPLALEIEHIGSTSVPGLAAKPIIDIAIGIQSYPWLAAAVDAVVALGYEHKREYGIPRRHYFLKGVPRTHHIHVLEVSSPQYTGHMLFRDYLRTHTEAAREYERLKRDLIRTVGGDHRSYEDGKSAFIQDIIAAARRLKDQRKAE